MNKQTAIRKLATWGFEIDWNVTGPHPEGSGWVGVIDPIGYTSIGGDCYGPSIDGTNAADWYKNAVTEAERLASLLQPCTNPECDMHAGAFDG